MGSDQLSTGPQCDKRCGRRTRVVQQPCLAQGRMIRKGSVFRCREERSASDHCVTSEPVREPS